MPNTTLAAGAERTTTGRAGIGEFLRANVIVAITAAIGLALRDRLNIIDVAMLFLLGIVIVALIYRPYPALAAAVLATALFDFVFVPPWYTFSVHDASYVLTFAMMLLLAVIVSRLATRIRDQGRAALALVEEREAAQAVANAEQLRTALLSSLSHDLRTPLATIEGAASTLVSDGDVLSRSAQQELAESIVGESRRMARLVSNLLDMVRLESGKLAVTGEWQPLEESLGVALLRTEEMLGTRAVRVEGVADLPLVLIDGLLIEQVFVNLLENAAKYTPPDTTIIVRAWSADKDVIVEVADSGPGIAPGELESVFHKFHRGPDTPDGVGGSGLGLTICRGIVTAHGGRMWVEAAPGGGAAFRFTLPRWTPPTVPEARGSAAPWP